jgi:hypothetical protein
MVCTGEFLWYFLHRLRCLELWNHSLGDFFKRIAPLWRYDRLRSKSKIKWILTFCIPFLKQVNEIVEKGQRLSQPEGCPDEVYKIMMDCWQYRDRLRPNFQFLARFFINRLSASKVEDVSEEQHENQENQKHSNTVYV